MSPDVVIGQAVDLDKLVDEQLGDDDGNQVILIVSLTIKRLPRFLREGTV